MHPPQSSCTTSLPQALMERLLMAGNGSDSGNDVKESAIKDIAVKLRQYENAFQLNGVNGNNGGASSPPATSPETYKRPDFIRLDNKAPAMALVCFDCGIMKNSAEEMEVHVKLEHLNWLPFRCPVCFVERASDVLIREHLHAAHREKMHNYIYSDNMEAKRLLTQMMDHSFANAVLIKNSNESLLSRGYNSSNGESRLETSSRLTLDYGDSSPSTSSPGISATVTAQHPSSIDNGANIHELLANIYKAARDGGIVEGEVVDQDDCNENIFINPKLENQDDDDCMDGDGGVLDSLNPISVLDNVAALFNTENCKEETPMEKTGKSGKTSGVGGPKKRVLGECSKCNKPVTAGARQMHMFFHLAKDHGVYRFRCLFEGCNTEHYRKDQMENHQVKSHGKIVPEKMEDRSLELFARCQALNHELFVANRSLISHQQPSQDLSMELIGTKNGSTPGPTAAKAEIAYQNQQAAKEREKNNKHANGHASKSDVPSTVSALADDDRILKCRKCGKTMQNRLRGFHVLWHLAKDKNINRYVCVLCNFAHDRAQSVQTHGKKEHREHPSDVCRDRIGEYDEEVKQMSMECFGFESSFATPDNKRRSKIPASAGGLSKNRKRPRIEVEQVQAVDDDAHSGHSPDPATEDVDHLEPIIPKPCSRSVQSSSKCTDISILRQISQLVEGVQFYDKRKAKGVPCSVCEKEPDNRLTEHVYIHMTQSLFVCPVCDFGHNCRDKVKSHITEIHETVERPIDHRLKYAADIKEAVRLCFPSIFVDAAVPTSEDIALLKGVQDSPEEEYDDDRESPRSFSSLTSMYSLYSEMSSETDPEQADADEHPV